MLKTFLRFIPTLLGLLFSILANELMAAGLIVNEASNGISGAKEFYEFMVVGDSANPTSPVNINQWIVDDNNGDWGGSITGVGISSGYIRFDSQTDPANCSGLNAITPGSIIVVYNGDDTNANMPSDDATDSNGDGVYIFPAEGSCLKTCAGPPSSSDAGYSSCSTPATPNYSTIAMRNGGDSAQSRDASGNLFHGFTYGDIPSPYPTNSFNVSTGSGSLSTFLFSCGSWYIGSNFSKISAIADTPGSTNNAANEIFRTNIQSGSFNYSNLSDAANCAVLSDPSISLRKSALTISDPINGTSNPKTIPGALKQYAIEATNAGIGVADLNSIVVTDAIPANTALYVDDISGVSTGPIRFVDGSPPSGLSYNYAGLSSASDNLSFSNNGGSSYTYTPTPDADGVDANVTHIRVSTTGQFLGTTVAGDPSFQLLFRVRVK